MHFGLALASEARDRVNIGLFVVLRLEEIHLLINPDDLLKPSSQLSVLLLELLHAEFEIE